MAGLGKRILGGIVDVVVLIIFSFIWGALFGAASAGGGSMSFNVSGAPALIMYLIMLAYFIVMEKLYGKTIGKMVVGTKVVSDGGGSISWGQSVIRNVLRIVDGLPFLYIVGMICIGASKKNQRVGDMAAKTTVV